MIDSQIYLSKKRKEWLDFNQVYESEGQERFFAYSLLGKIFHARAEALPNLISEDVDGEFVRVSAMLSDGNIASLAYRI